MHTFSKTAQLLTVALATTLGLSWSAQTQAAASATQVIESPTAHREAETAKAHRG